MKIACNESHRKSPQPQDQESRWLAKMQPSIKRRQSVKSVQNSRRMQLPDTALECMRNNTFNVTNKMYFQNSQSSLSQLFYNKYKMSNWNKKRWISDFNIKLLILPKSQWTLKYNFKRYIYLSSSHQMSSRYYELAAQSLTSTGIDVP